MSSNSGGRELPLGEEGGQRYPLEKAIRTTLEEMGKDIPTGAVLVKELLQNADDAGASELELILDERLPYAKLVEQLKEQGFGTLQPLLEPALLVRNNAPFRRREDGGRHDDFEALRTVADGHKLGEVSAAGRFGIGFNSVYFLTDTPIIFSRQEVHIFDPLRRCFRGGGWKFQLDSFRSTSASGAGVLKQLLTWCLPSQALDKVSFETLASQRRDFQQAVLRLPLRRRIQDQDSMYRRFLAEPGLDRKKVLEEMVEVAARSLVFLKRVRKVEFGRLDPDGTLQTVAVVQASDNRQPEEWSQFLHEVEVQAPGWMQGGDWRMDLDTGPYLQTIDLAVTGLEELQEGRRWTFLARQRVEFSSEELHRQAERLHLNGERAVPWVGVAFPCNAASFEATPPSWRVFLPIVAAGPCSALFHLAGFVDPSRQGLSFRARGSDEERRKTDWNIALIQRALAPLAQKMTSGLVGGVQPLIESDPARYLSLFPDLPKTADAESLA